MSRPKKKLNVDFVREWTNQDTCFLNKKSIKLKSKEANHIFGKFNLLYMKKFPEVQCRSPIADWCISDFIYFFKVSVGTSPPEGKRINTKILIIEICVEMRDERNALRLLNQLRVLRSLEDPHNIFLDFRCKKKGFLFSKEIYEFKIYYRYQSRRRSRLIIIKVIFLKKKLLEMPHANNLFMRHLLVGLLLSYRKLLDKVEFHGGINQNSVIGVDKAKDLEVNYNLFTKGQPLFWNQKLRREYKAYNYQLIYHHKHMLSISEWVKERFDKLQKGSK